MNPLQIYRHKMYAKAIFQSSSSASAQRRYDPETAAMIVNCSIAIEERTRTTEEEIEGGIEEDGDE